MAKKDNLNLTDSHQAFLIYQDDNGITQENVRFEGEDVWLPVELIMQLFDASQQDVSYHIRQIYAEGELDRERTNKKFLLVRQEGNRSVNRQISHSYFFPHRAERLHLSCVLLHLETNGNMNENKLPMKQLKQEDTAMEKSGTVEKMMKRVMKKMTAKGIKCKSEEAELSYLWCNHPYKARFCPNKPNGFRAEILVAMKTDTWDQISNEGKTVWVNKVNMNNSQMKFISLDNMFLCQYTTFIKKPADFLSEIEHGDDLIGATLTTAFEMLTEIKEQYAVKPLTFPIGFRINRMAG